MAVVPPPSSPDAGAPEASVDSPLWMVSQAPGLNALVVALQNHRRALDARQMLQLGAQARRTFRRHVVLDAGRQAGLVRELVVGCIVVVFDEGFAHGAILRPRSDR